MQVIQFTPGKQLFLARCARQPVNEGKKYSQSAPECRNTRLTSLETSCFVLASR